MTPKQARAAIRRIQKTLGVPLDEVVGPVTHAGLDRLNSIAWPPAAKETKIGQLAGIPIFRDASGNIHFTAGMTIDADGSPRCYHPKGSPPGLDYLANAGKPGNWWGIATDAKGRPYVQVAGDPYPGFYVSTTALQNVAFGIDNPSRYTDSEKVPFVVLPPNFPVKCKLGARLIVTNTENGKRCDAIYADIGPKTKLGEGSMALAAALGIGNSPKTGGTSKKIIRYTLLA